MMSVDVCIVGGGPVGCLTAFHLGRAGIRVLVLEEHHDIGEPVDCSGVIGVEAFEQLEIPREAIRDHLQNLDVVSPSGKRIAFCPSRILAHIVDRAAFDRTLADRARTVGATIWTSACVEDLDVTNEGVRFSIRVQGARASVRAQAAVLAGGPRYRLQQHLGMGSPSKYLKTVQADIETVRGGGTQIFLGSHVAPGSFAWWLPVKGRDGYRVKIGVSATQGSRAAFHAFLQLLRSQGHLNPQQEIRPRSWMIPITPIPHTYSSRVLAVGDAAGQTKPTTGGGLYYGPLCAKIAAEVLIGGLGCGDLSAAFLAQYEQQWRRVLGRELATANRFRRLFEQLSDAEMDQLFDFLSQDGLIRFLEETVDFDWHRRTILRAVARLPYAAAFLARFRSKPLAELLS